VSPIRRLVAVGSVATVLDVVLLVVLAQVVGWPVAGADAVAILAATAASASGHLRFTFSDEPSARWFRDAPRYLATAAAALAVDVVVLALLTGNGPVSSLRLLGAKAVSLTAAFLLRSFLFRRTMFAAVRSDQGAPRRREPAPGAVRLSLVIPAYCEEDGIAATIERVERELGHLRDEGGFELVVVDDGSPDATAEVARSAGADRVVQLDPNRGKGGAVRAGVLAATGRTIAFTDADLSYSPSQVLRLMDEVEAGWDVVVGSRRHTDARALVAARRLREVGGRVVNMLTWLVLLGQYRDTQCGLKAFRSDVARMIFSVTRVDGFAFDVEVFHLAERYRLSLHEVPVEVVNSSRSTVHVVRDTWRLVRDLFRIRRVGRSGGYELSVADVPPTLVEPHRPLVGQTAAGGGGEGVVEAVPVPGAEGADR
jgi:dolichyl-phosphate beta-glucosyltransferase